MKQKILITGGSGLVGSRLTELLIQHEFQVIHLGRNKSIGEVPSFTWDVEKQRMDSAALAEVSTIIHLAGAGVADKRWTDQRKKEILASRIKSTQLLFDTLKKENHQVKTVVAASAVGYYGFGLKDEIFSEESRPGSDFLASVTAQWEEEVDKISTLGIRVVKLRIGIVLSEKGGALAEMANPIRYGVGAPLGTGNQYLSWIHMDDLCGMFIKATDDHKMIGTYNAVGAGWVTNREMTHAIAHVLDKPILLPSVPGFALKIILGEMADMVLNGSKVSSEKIQQAGFTFKYTSLNDALTNLLLTA
jgi:hypothetical protein